MTRPALKNDTFIRAARREPTPYTPVWMMRQAGRYLPEYRATREKAGDFLSLCKNPELAAEVTIQPIDRFDIDAAILFSDILVVPEAMGMDLSFQVGEGPVFSDPIRTLHDVDRLPIIEAEDKLGYVMAAIKEINGRLDGRVPLIGFTGAPWTLATYMIEGGSSKDFATTKRMAFDAPAMLDRVIDKVTENVINYAKAQVKAGIHAFQIFDTWAGVLDPRLFERYCAAPIQRIVEALGDEVPVTVFAKGCAQHSERLAATGCSVLGLDWTTNLGPVREKVGGQVALQGNMDPSVLYAKPEVIRDEVKRMLEDFGNHPGHIANLGHGIHPAVPPSHAGAFIEAVHEISRRMRG